MLDHLVSPDRRYRASNQPFSASNINRRAEDHQRFEESLQGEREKQIKITQRKDNTWSRVTLKDTILASSEKRVFHL